MDSPAFMSKTSMPLSSLYVVCWLYSAINLGSTDCIPTSSHSSIKSATDIS